MMNKIASLMAGAAFVALAPAAFAADMPVAPAPYEAVAPVPEAPLAYDWTGFYIGAHGGYGFGSTEDSLFDSDTEGFIAGGQVGYNQQFGNWVAGLEADASYTDLDNDDDAVDFNSSLNYLATVRGRVGFAFDKVLVYGTGGLAFGEVEYDNGVDSGAETQLGWTAGGGVEVGLSQNLSVKGEYLYVDLGEEDYGAETVEFNAHTVKGGINYRF
ncbi:outer membrane protein [Terrihabitans sp. B22-R8]|uniref:outer membrane protein n=1 Tax=Terrihabitans sp. B22-R8 TaxID=3425128 RepID=UPI00403D2B81